MKYVYVLTCSKNDLYYEQFLISIVSLRLSNPNAHVVVLIDSKTKKNLTELRAEYEQYITEIIIINAPDKFSQKEVSRWIKTSIYNYISDDFLYIDCDTVICNKLDLDILQEINVGAILDTHVPLAKHHLKDHFQNEDKRLNFFSSFVTEKRYNGGVLLCRKSKEGNDLFECWHSLWIYSNENGNFHDMPALNQANYEIGNVIKELPGEWNCQITHNGLPYLYNAKIIHYYATAFNFRECPYLPGSKEILLSIKKTGSISSELMNMLNNPKTAFENDSRIISGAAELDTVNSKLFSVLLRIRKKNPNFFNKLNTFFIKFFSRNN